MVRALLVVGVALVWEAAVGAAPGAYRRSKLRPADEALLLETRDEPAGQLSDAGEHAPPEAVQAAAVDRAPAGDVAVNADGPSDPLAWLTPWVLVESGFKRLGKDFYHMALAPLLALTVILAYCTRPKTDETLPDGFCNFKWKYLCAWFVAVGGDWLQGPYVYALYASYGYSGSEIAQLFVAGFGASMIFGTFMGVVADNWGRKRSAVLYCVLYVVSCLTKHFNHYWILMFGRVTGGIATSLLFSTFECWLVSEHVERHRFSPALLRYMFGLMYFGNYAVAIMAGLVAQAACDNVPQGSSEFGFNWGGYTMPFDIAACILAMLILPLCLFWEENYGNSVAGVNVFSSLGSALRAVATNWRVCLLGIIVTGYEACMYAFIFNWTPALSSKITPPPHGLIFALFMMSAMCGSSVFSILSARLPPGAILIPILVLAAVSLGAAAFCFGSEFLLPVVFFCFLVFEFSVGFYFPTIGTLKSQLVEESTRAGVYNIFRVPLNAAVVGLLLSDLSLTTCLGICCSLIAVSAAALVPVVSFPPQVPTAKGK